MRAECCARPARRALFGSSLGLVAGVVAALLPKCPLCIAAYLSVLGVGTASARAIAPLAFPAGIALIAISLAWMLLLVRRASRASPSSCSSAAPHRAARDRP